MTEAEIQARIMLELGGRPDTRIFRNHVAKGFTGDVLRTEGDLVVLRNARRASFGLCIGSSDLIGWHRRTITEADLGRTLALFTAIEVKARRGVSSDEQDRFLAAVQQAGGLAGIARSPGDAIAVIGGSPC